MPTRISLLVAASLALAAIDLRAQQIDIMEFGQYSAFAVRSATWLDYYRMKCKGDTQRVHENLVDFALSHIGGRSSSTVRRGAAIALKISEAEVKSRTVDEAKQQIAALGGCESMRTQEWVSDVWNKFESYQRYLAEVAVLYQNGGDRIFR